jgi:hypothetical protein
MPVLTSQQRNTLESAIKTARKLAEAGAINALQAIAVNHPEPFAHMSPEQRYLRNRLRNKARLLGDELTGSGQQQINALSYELAYENWHKMLFAKFLETNGLLMHPSGVAVTMEECEELAAEERFTDKWDAAANYASKMLPAIFRPEDPLMQVKFASNDRIKLEEILDGLDAYIFTADDALGWVYQFWQSEAKEAINKSGDKIDGAKLPAVTQLFTEPYMVHFLIDNTLGAWWVSRNPGVKPPVKFEYLRLLDDGTPAAGKFEGWPDKTAAITSLDPCMGSGHFVAALFPVFTALRMHEESLTKEEATDKVITENLHGLELDARCTQIAAFNLALTAWKFIGHYKQLPEMNLACSGIAPKGKKGDWVKLVSKENDQQKKQRLENGMKMMYDHFQLAPELGSLLDPTTIKGDPLFTASFEELQPVLKKALENEENTEQLERGVMASGIAKAGSILTSKYDLIITNVPYLGRGRQSDWVFNYLKKHFPDSKSDLATVFIDKLLRNLNKSGLVSTVAPQNWLFLTSYKKFREKLLKNNSLNFIVRLGSGAFTEITGEVVKAIMVSIQNRSQIQIDKKVLVIDVEPQNSIQLKDNGLKKSFTSFIIQQRQLTNPDFRITLSDIKQSGSILNSYAEAYQGLVTGDRNSYIFKYWEIDRKSKPWDFFADSFAKEDSISGKDSIILWEEGKGRLHQFAISNRDKLHDMHESGQRSWGKKGILITRIGLKTTPYFGEKYDNNLICITAKNEEHTLPIYNFCRSIDFKSQVKALDQKLSLTNATATKVKIEMDDWQSCDEMPFLFSNDATQWLFHGNPIQADNPLNVATSRLLGYRWPAENDTEMELADEARDLMRQVKAFDDLTDEDGILCIPSINGELAGSERLRSFLQTVYCAKWDNNTISQLLAKEGAKESNLEDWLRNSFFEQHCKLFKNRPFIWQIWDGRKDGFSALVNYHKLNKENLQRLIFTYLGDWIRQCQAKKKSGESGAEGLLSAATKLKEKLEAILEGENPFDIFVRWKPLDQQPIGWDPDLNDGVRLNIRPFVEAGILRNKFNVKWGIDRGINPPGSYWGEVRDNDKHLSLEEKREGRKNTNNN